MGRSRKRIVRAASRDGRRLYDSDYRGNHGINQSLSVNVAAMSSQSMTFTTNPGHLIYPGYITFAASLASAGAINFNINLGGTVANSAEFNFCGSAFEDAQWNHFLGQVSGFCKVGH